MSTAVPCYLVEWYRPAAMKEPIDNAAAKLNETAASMSAHGSRVQLLTMLDVPTDEVLFGVFVADSASIVADTCDRAGMPAQRLTTATDLDLTPRQ